MMERDDIHIISKSKPSKRGEDVEKNNNTTGGENKRNKIVALTISGTLPQSLPLVGGVGKEPPPVMKF